MRLGFIKDKFFIEATRDIMAGEEFLMDYSVFFYLPCTSLWLKKRGLKSPQEKALYYEALAKPKTVHGNKN